MRGRKQGRSVLPRAAPSGTGMSLIEQTYSGGVDEAVYTKEANRSSRSRRVVQQGIFLKWCQAAETEQRKRQSCWPAESGRGYSHVSARLGHPRPEGR